MEYRSLFISQQQIQGASRQFKLGVAAASVLVELTICMDLLWAIIQVLDG